MWGLRCRFTDADATKKVDAALHIMICIALA